MWPEEILAIYAICSPHKKKKKKKPLIKQYYFFFSVIYSRNEKNTLNVFLNSKVPQISSRPGPKNQP